MQEQGKATRDELAHDRNWRRATSRRGTLTQNLNVARHVGRRERSSMPNARPDNGVPCQMPAPITEFHAKCPPRWPQPRILSRDTRRRRDRRYLAAQVIPGVVRVRDPLLIRAEISSGAPRRCRSAGVRAPLQTAGCVDRQRATSTPLTAFESTRPAHARPTWLHRWRPRRIPARTPCSLAGDATGAWRKVSRHTHSHTRAAVPVAE
ncbi:hypothetical protein PHYPSEUDO_000570 [Phytophthora pseudosyringae]|uniref:Uncharacterized protein n=1 Tax=Phytophthora pseudosyringae TaxID=221518 RepID=A0A8T1V2S5_9STRA|nr:hypothetical protein PHYPSEUDO_000570 [Phytophthora pseudosyringae]